MTPLTSIQPLPRLSLFEALADQIEERILAGQLEAGAKLPSEDALARQFGVSRPVVREALAQLRERGLVETVSGSGTFVKHPDADHLTEAVLRHLRVAAGETESIGKRTVGATCVSRAMSAKRVSSAGKRTVAANWQFYISGLRLSAALHRIITTSVRNRTDGSTLIDHSLHRCGGERFIRPTPRAGALGFRRSTCRSCWGLQSVI